LNSTKLVNSNIRRVFFSQRRKVARRRRRRRRTNTELHREAQRATEEEVRFEM